MADVVEIEEHPNGCGPTPWPWSMRYDVRGADVIDEWKPNSPLVAAITGNLGTLDRKVTPPACAEFVTFNLELEPEKK